MSIEYAWSHYIVATGTLTQGRNSGKTLVRHEQDLGGANDLESVISKCAEYRSLEPSLKLEIWRKQYRSRPTKHFHKEFVQEFS
jgi:hypothetical protein